MAIQLNKKCPDCGHEDLYRIPRKWFMRLIPFTKRYYCKDCHSNFMVNFWAAITVMPITLALRPIIFVLWRYTGLNLLWQKTHAPTFSSEEESWRVLNQFRC